jgi:hypothetical protein
VETVVSHFAFEQKRTDTDFLHRFPAARVGLAA